MIHIQMKERFKEHKLAIIICIDGIDQCMNLSYDSYYKIQGSEAFLVVGKVGV